MIKVRGEITAEQLNRNSKGSLSSFLGVEIVDVKQGEVRSRLEIRKHHLAINGFLHAASVVALADSTCGNATLAHLPEHAKSFTTIELKSNFLGTAREGAIACVATAQHLGKTTQVWDATVSDEATGRKLALFRCTQLILGER